MNLKEAEKIVQSYGTALAHGTEGVARYESWLPQSKETIIKAFKLYLSFLIEFDSLTKRNYDELLVSASGLSSFIEDDKAKKINNTVRLYKEKDPSQRPSDEDMEEFMNFSKQMVSLTIQQELQDFIDEVGRLDKEDQLFHQRVYTLIGLEYSPEKKQSFWNIFK